ncbi:MAG TPA: helical backbone metal receptor [Chitinophagales bacterium]|nr:helical backbone metal receptor [Chitinophagales bacterium]
MKEQVLHSTDQMGRSVEISFPPRRIVSLVPSQTELLFDLGLDEEICGITRFCIHPADKVAGKTKIGGTKQFDIEKIKSLQPDLIIGNKEENYLEGITELQQHFPVWMSDIFTLQDNAAMMQEVARITNREKEGAKLIEQIQSGFNQYNPASALRGKTASYSIWRKPYMVAANNTFINHLLGVFGVSNVFGNEERYPEIEPELLSHLKPDFIFLSSEPYRFTEKHYEEFQAFCPTSKVLLVDGELFSWYGSRLKHTPAYFEKLQAELLL